MKWIILAVVVAVIVLVIVRELRIAKRSAAARGTAGSSSWSNNTNASAVATALPLKGNVSYAADSVALAPVEPEPREKPVRHRDPSTRPSRDVVLAALRKACDGSPKTWILARDLAVAIEADGAVTVDSREVGTVLVQLRGDGQARSKRERNTMLWRPVAARRTR